MAHLSALESLGIFSATNEYSFIDRSECQQISILVWCPSYGDLLANHSSAIVLVTGVEPCRQQEVRDPLIPPPSQRLTDCQGKDGHPCVVIASVFRITGHSLHLSSLLMLSVSLLCYRSSFESTSFRSNLSLIPGIFAEQAYGCTLCCLQRSKSHRMVTIADFMHWMTLSEAVRVCSSCLTNEDTPGPLWHCCCSV